MLWKEEKDDLGSSKLLREDVERLWNQGLRTRPSNASKRSDVLSRGLTGADEDQNDREKPWRHYYSHQLPFAYNFLDTADSRWKKHLEPGDPHSIKRINESTHSVDNQLSVWSSSSRLNYDLSASSQSTHIKEIDSTPCNTNTSDDTSSREGFIRSSVVRNMGEDKSNSDASDSFSNGVKEPRSMLPGATTTEPSSMTPDEINPMLPNLERTYKTETAEKHQVPGAIPKKSNSSNSVLMDILNSGGNSQFSPGVRAKLKTVLPTLINTIPFVAKRTITIAEYGCMNSRAMHLFRPIIEQFVTRALSNDHIELSATQATQDTTRGSLAGFVEETADTVNFQVVHEDSQQFDFRLMLRLLEVHPESYLDPLWQSSHSPPLQNAIYSTFVSRPFGSRIVPPDTLQLGFSLMDLHWTHTPNTNVSLPSMAHAELSTFLNARAREFSRGGIFVVAFIARSETCSAGCVKNQCLSVCDASKKRTESSASGSNMVSSSLNNKCDRDIWEAMTNMLVPCLQRLVSCGMIKIDVARQLMTLPMHPRTPTQTLRVLDELAHIWELAWSCGLGKSNQHLMSCENGETITIHHEPETLRLPQPAWLSLQAGKISPATYNDHVINMFKSLHESHFRLVLREKGKLSKGAVEFILDSLWDVLRSRMDDPSSSPLAHCELEVQLFALKRL